MSSTFSSWFYVMDELRNCCATQKQGAYKRNRELSLYFCVTLYSEQFGPLSSTDNKNHCYLIHVHLRTGIIIDKNIFVI